MPTEQPAPDNAKNLDEGKNKAPDMFSENVAATRKLIGTYDPEQWFKKKQENKDARPAWDQTAIMKRQGELIEATEATTLRTVKQTKDGKEVETKELGKTTLGIIDIYDGISGNAERIDAMRISKSIENKEADETILKHELSATQERVALYESMALQLHSYMKLVETYDLLKKGALENGLTIDKKKDSAVTLHLAHTQMLAGKRIALACETLPITKTMLRLMAEEGAIRKEHDEAQKKDPTVTLGKEKQEQLLTIARDIRLEESRLALKQEESYKIDAELFKHLEDKEGKPLPVLEGIESLLQTDYAAVFYGQKSLADLSRKYRDIRRGGRQAPDLEKELDKSNKKFETLQNRGQANVAALTNIIDTVGGYQIAQTRLASVRHQFGQIYDLAAVDGKPWAEKTAEEQRDKLDGYFQANARASADRIQGHIQAIDTSVLNFDPAKGGKEFCANMAERVGNLRAAFHGTAGFTPRRLWQSKDLRFHLQRNAYEAVGWTLDGDGLPIPWEKLPKAKQEEIAGKEENMRKKVDRFKTSNGYTNMRKWAAIVQELTRLQQNDVRFHPRALAGEATQKDIENVANKELTVETLKQYPSRAVVIYCHEQLQKSWQTYLPEYRKLMYDADEMIGLHHELTDAEHRDDVTQFEAEQRDKKALDYAIFAVPVTPMAVRGGYWIARNSPELAARAAEKLGWVPKGVRTPGNLTPWKAGAKGGSWLGRSAKFVAVGAELYCAYENFVAADAAREFGRKAVEHMRKEIEDNLGAMGLESFEEDGRTKYRTEDGNITIDLNEAAFAEADAEQLKGWISLGTAAGLTTAYALGASNPVGWAIIGVSVIVKAGIDINKDAKYYKFIQHAPPWLLYQLGTQGMLGKLEHDILDDSWYDVIFLDKLKTKTVREKLLFSYLSSSLGRTTEGRQMMGEIIGGPANVESINKTFDFVFRNVGLPAFKISLFSSENVPRNFPIKNIDNLEIDHKGRTIDKKHIEEALRQAAGAMVNHMRELRFLKRMRELEDCNADLQKVEKEILACEGKEKDAAYFALQVKANTMRMKQQQLELVTDRMGQQRMFMRTLKESYPELRKNNADASDPKPQLEEAEKQLAQFKGKEDTMEYRWALEPVERLRRDVKFYKPGEFKPVTRTVVAMHTLTMAMRSMKSGSKAKMKFNEQSEYTCGYFDGSGIAVRMNNLNGLPTKTIWSRDNYLYRVDGDLLPPARELKEPPFSMKNIGDLSPQFDKIYSQYFRLRDEKPNLEKEYRNQKMAATPDLMKLAKIEAEVDRHYIELREYERDRTDYIDDVASGHRMTERANLGEEATEHRTSMDTKLFPSEPRPLVFVSGFTEQQLRYGRDNEMLETVRALCANIIQYEQINDLRASDRKAVHVISYPGYERKYMVKFVYDNFCLECGGVVNGDIGENKDPRTTWLGLPRRSGDQQAIIRTNEVLSEQKKNTEAMERESRTLEQVVKELTDTRQWERQLWRTSLKNFKDEQYTVALSKSFLIKKEGNVQYQLVRHDDVEPYGTTHEKYILIRTQTSLDGTIQTTNMSTHFGYDVKNTPEARQAALLSQVNRFIKVADEYYWDKTDTTKIKEKMWNDGLQSDFLYQKPEDQRLAIATIFGTVPPQGKGMQSVLVPGGLVDQMSNLYSQLDSKSVRTQEAQEAFMRVLHRTLIEHKGTETPAQQNSILHEMVTYTDKLMGIYHFDRFQRIKAVQPRLERWDDERSGRLRQALHQFNLKNETARLELRTGPDEALLLTSLISVENVPTPLLTIALQEQLKSKGLTVKRTAMAGTKYVQLEFDMPFGIDKERTPDVVLLELRKSLEGFAGKDRRHDRSNIDRGTLARMRMAMFAETVSASNTNFGPTLPAWAGKPIVSLWHEDHGGYISTPTIQTDTIRYNPFSNEYFTYDEKRKPKKISAEQGSAINLLTRERTFPDLPARNIISRAELQSVRWTYNPKFKAWYSTSESPKDGELSLTEEGDYYIFRKQDGVTGNKAWQKLTVEGWGGIEDKLGPPRERGVFPLDATHVDYDFIRSDSNWHPWPGYPRSEASHWPVVPGTLVRTKVDGSYVYKLCFACDDARADRWVLRPITVLWSAKDAVQKENVEIVANVLRRMQEAKPPVVQLAANGDLQLGDVILVRNWKEMLEQNPIEAIDLLATGLFDLERGKVSPDLKKSFASLQQSLRKNVGALDRVFSAPDVRSIESPQLAVTEKLPGYQEQLDQGGANKTISNLPTNAVVQVEGQALRVNSGLLIGDTAFQRSTSSLMVMIGNGKAPTLTIDGKPYNVSIGGKVESERPQLFARRTFTDGIKKDTSVFIADKELTTDDSVESGKALFLRDENGIHVVLDAAPALKGFPITIGGKQLVALKNKANEVFLVPKGEEAKVPEGKPIPEQKTEAPDPTIRELARRAPVGEVRFLKTGYQVIKTRDGDWTYIDSEEKRFPSDKIDEDTQGTILAPDSYKQLRDLTKDTVFEPSRDPKFSLSSYAFRNLVDYDAMRALSEAMPKGTIHPAIKLTTDSGMHLKGIEFHSASEEGSTKWEPVPEEIRSAIESSLKDTKPLTTERLSTLGKALAQGIKQWHEKKK